MPLFTWSSPLTNTVCNAELACLLCGTCIYIHSCYHKLDWICWHNGNLWETPTTSKYCIIITSRVTLTCTVSFLVYYCHVMYEKSVYWSRETVWVCFCAENVFWITRSKSITWNFFSQLVSEVDILFVDLLVIRISSNLCAWKFKWGSFGTSKLVCLQVDKSGLWDLSCDTLFNCHIVTTRQLRWLDEE